MAMNRPDILRAMANRRIVITPFEEESLNTSSYDVRLGRFYYRQNPQAAKLVCPWEEVALARRSNITSTLSRGIQTDTYKWPYVLAGSPEAEGDGEYEGSLWEKKHRTAGSFKDLILVKQDRFTQGSLNVSMPNMNPSTEVIMLEPGEIILAHTEEFIGGCDDKIVCMMKARSTIGRNGIDVCSDAGWGDVGFCTRWTLEIQNKNPKQHMLLIAGMRIAQVVFFEGCEVEAAYKGKYQPKDPAN